MDSTFYFNQRGRYSVYEKVYCKGTRVSHKGGSVTHSQMTVTYNNDSSYHRFHLETFEYIRSFSDRNDHIFGGPIRRKSQTHPVARTERLEHIANDYIQNNGTKSRQSYQLRRKAQTPRPLA